MKFLNANRVVIWAAMMVAAVSTVCTPLGAWAQASAVVQPRFDVSAVRASDPGAGNKPSVSLNGQDLKASNVTLAMLIRLAYGLSEDQLSGGPSWIGSRRFDVTAKADAAIDPKLSPGAAQQIQRAMMQRFLGERFQLKVRHESKSIPGYVLTVTKGGAKGMQADETGSTGMSLDGGKLHATAITMDQLADALSRGVLQTPVTNATALAGKFDVDVMWDLRAARLEGTPEAPNDLGPSIFLALQQQLGLKLEEHKTAADAIVVESAEMPEAN